MSWFRRLLSSMMVLKNSLPLSSTRLYFRSMSLKPRIAVSGVRSSCETKETISLFAWFNSCCAVASCRLKTTPAVEIGATVTL